MTIASTGKTVITGVKQTHKAEEYFENLSNRVAQMEDTQ
jgi:TATA-box binding protein (TBP) (component of TFIID and TFIIIB)